MRGFLVRLDDDVQRLHAIWAGVAVWQRHDGLEGDVLLQASADSVCVLEDGVGVVVVDAGRLAVEVQRDACCDPVAYALQRVERRGLLLLHVGDGRQPAPLHSGLSDACQCAQARCPCWRGGSG